MSAWSVYVLRCADGALYTGVTTDVDRRVAEHESGHPKGARSLRGRGPLELLGSHVVGERGAALRLEARIKRLPRARKIDVLRHWDALAEILAELDDPA